MGGSAPNKSCRGVCTRWAAAACVLHLCAPAGKLAALSARHPLQPVSESAPRLSRRGEAAARLPSWRFSLHRTSLKSVEILPRESGEWRGEKKKDKYLLSTFAFKSARFGPIGREVGVLTCCEPASFECLSHKHWWTVAFLFLGGPFIVPNVWYRSLNWVSSLGPQCNSTADVSFANLYFSSRSLWLTPLSSERKSVDGGKLPVTDLCVGVVQTFAPTVMCLCSSGAKH